MTQAKLTSGDLVGYGGFLGGNDGTMVLEVGPAGAKVNALSIDAAGRVTTPLTVQAYQDVRTSPGRALGTSYTNSTGLPIKVFVAADIANANTLINATIGGVVVQISTGSVAGYRGIGIFEVPAGATYSVTAVSGTLSNWVELR